MFADDIAVYPNLELFENGRSMDSEWQSNFQSALDTISTWASNNAMEFNSSKSNVLYFTGNYQINTATLHSQHQFHIDSFVLERTDSYCYLGVWHESKLKWNI